MSAQSRPSQGLLPISRYQGFMLQIAQETAPTSPINQEKTIRWAFRITPSLPPRALRRAFEKLVERHDSLRLRFVKTGADWRAEICPGHATGIRVHDLSHLSAPEQDAEIRARSKEPLTALAPALFDMQVLRCGQAGDVLLTRMNHAVGDGYSVAILIEDLLKFLLSVPVVGPAPGHADFLRIRQAGLEDRPVEKERYWQSQLLPLPEDLNIGRTLKGLEKNSVDALGPTRRLDNVLPAELAPRLEQIAKSTDATVYSVLFSAFAESICAIGQNEAVMIRTAISRYQAELANFVGADVQAITTKYTCDPGDLAGRAAWVTEQITQGAAHLPTYAFDDGSVIDQAYIDADTSRSRFLVNMEVPSGRLKGSPFNTLFSKARTGAVTIGTVTLEQIALPQEVETNYELMLQIDLSKNLPAVSLVGNAEAYDADDLARIAQGMQRRIAKS